MKIVESPKHVELPDALVEALRTLVDDVDDQELAEDDDCTWVTIKGNAVCIQEGHGRHTRSSPETPDTRPWHEVKDVDEAYRRLTKGQRVVLRQRPMVSTLLDKLAVEVDRAAKAGRTLHINLCDVSVKGTNLFCVDNVGVKRVEMPQFSGRPRPGTPADKLPRNARGNVDLAPAFRDYLKDKGIKIDDTTVQASFLKASQRELSGVDIAKLMKAIEAGQVPDKRMFVSKDHYVIDGHHRWAAQIGLDFRRGDDYDRPLPVARIDASILDVLVHAWQFATRMGLGSKATNVKASEKWDVALWRELAADPDEDCHWVTLDNGAKVCIDNKSGTITKGPDALVGKTKEEASGGAKAPDETTKKKKKPKAAPKKTSSIPTGPSVEEAQWLDKVKPGGTLDYIDPDDEVVSAKVISVDTDAGEVVVEGPAGSHVEVPLEAITGFKPTPKKSLVIGPNGLMVGDKVTFSTSTTKQPISGVVTKVNPGFSVTVQEDAGPDKGSSILLDTSWFASGIVKLETVNGETVEVTSTTAVPQTHADALAQAGWQKLEQTTEFGHSIYAHHGHPDQSIVLHKNGESWTHWKVSPEEAMAGVFKHGAVLGGSAESGNSVTDFVEHLSTPLGKKTHDGLPIIGHIGEGEDGASLTYEDITVGDAVTFTQSNGVQVKGKVVSTSDGIKVEPVGGGTAWKFTKHELETGKVTLDALNGDDVTPAITPATVSAAAGLVPQALSQYSVGDIVSYHPGPGTLSTGAVIAITSDGELQIKTPQGQDHFITPDMVTAYSQVVAQDFGAESSDLLVGDFVVVKDAGNGKPGLVQVTEHTEAGVKFTGPDVAQGEAEYGDILSKFHEPSDVGPTGFTPEGLDTSDAADLFVPKSPDDAEVYARLKEQRAAAVATIEPLAQRITSDKRVFSREQIQVGDTVVFTSNVDGALKTYTGIVEGLSVDTADVLLPEGNVPTVKIEDITDVTPFQATSWDSVPETAQEEAKQHWTSANWDSEIEAVTEMYHEGLDEEIRDAMAKDRTWLEGNARTILSGLGVREESIDDALEPFNGDVNTIDISKLEYVQGDYVQEQGALPGFDPEVLKHARKQTLWNSIKDAFTEEWQTIYEEEFDSRKREAENTGLPDSWQQVARDNLEELWEEQDDNDKLQYYKTHVQEKREKPEPRLVGATLPGRIRVVRDGEDYERTRAFGRTLTFERTKQLFAERGLDIDDAGSVANDVWSRWKESSTSGLGLALQLATAEELGGKHRLDEADIKLAHRAARQYFGDRGMDAIKAYVRAQWEVTQYLLHKANAKAIAVYRGVMLPHDEIARTPKESVGPYTRLPKLPLKRNGAASFTATASVANSWGGVDIAHIKNPRRVVLRANVPATAVLSLPVYGQNYHSEQEVVVAGTPWLKWEAWYEKAPLVNEYTLSDPGILWQDDADDGEADFVIDLDTPRHWLSRPDETPPDETPPETPIESTTNRLTPEQIDTLRSRFKRVSRDIFGMREKWDVALMRALAVDEDEDCHWVTLDNGAKVCISNKTGRMVKGPDAIIKGAQSGRREPEQEGTRVKKTPQGSRLRPIPDSGPVPITDEERAWLDEIEKHPMIKLGEQALRGQSTAERYLDADGRWTPERAALHEKIVSKYLNPKAKTREGETPNVILFLGSPGAGKTSTLTPEIKDLARFTVVNPDDMKNELPEYNGYNAGLLHEESDYMADALLLGRAIRERHNIVIDSTGKTWSKYLRIARHFKEMGYRVEAYFVDVDPLVATQRAIKRFISGGTRPRYVNPRYVLTDVDGRPSKTYERLKESGLVDRVVKYDNSGTKPRKVEDLTLDIKRLSEREPT